MDQAAIGSRIKAARERAHLTQEQLAEIVDISPTHMSVIERSVKTPKLDTFVRIANALGVSADALLQDVVEHANESVMSDPSHVLMAIGLPHEIAHGSLRVTLGEQNTEEDVDYLIEKITYVVKTLRDMSPVWDEKISGQPMLKLFDK